jgi:hypothetical protein
MFQIKIVVLAERMNTSITIIANLKFQHYSHKSQFHPPPNLTTYCPIPFPDFQVGIFRNVSPQNFCMNSVSLHSRLHAELS